MPARRVGAALNSSRKSQAVTPPTAAYAFTTPCASPKPRYRRHGAGIPPPRHRVRSTSAFRCRRSGGHQRPLLKSRPRELLAVEHRYGRLPWGVSRVNSTAPNEPVCVFDAATLRSRLHRSPWPRSRAVTTIGMQQIRRSSWAPPSVSPHQDYRETGSCDHRRGAAPPDSGLPSCIRPVATLCGGGFRLAPEQAQLQRSPWLSASRMRIFSPASVSARDCHRLLQAMASVAEEDPEPLSPLSPGQHDQLSRPSSVSSSSELCSATTIPVEVPPRLSGPESARRSDQALLSHTSPRTMLHGKAVLRLARPSAHVQALST